MKIAVCWERVNEISVKELLEMAEDGYEFILQDGRISGIFVPGLENQEKWKGKWDGNQRKKEEPATEIDLEDISVNHVRYLKELEVMVRMAAYGAEREWESETGMILMLISGCLEKLVESGTELKNMFAQYFANREKCREETADVIL